MTPRCEVVSRDRDGRSLATRAANWTLRAGVGTRPRQASRNEAVPIETLGLLLVVLYVIAAVGVCDPGTTRFVGWEPGTARLRSVSTRASRVWLYSSITSRRPHVAAAIAQHVSRRPKPRGRRTR